MASREALLSKAHWQEVALTPALRRMPVDELAALDSLVEFMGRHGCTTLSDADCRAWARLAGGADWLERAVRAVGALEGEEAPQLASLRRAAEAFEARRKFAGISREPRRANRRVKSVPEAELPEAWRRHLAEIDASRRVGDIAMVDDIYDRMKRKLCEYCRYVRAENLEDDLTLDGLRAFFIYETTRETTRGAPARPATIVNTFTDLRRFMQLTGVYPHALVEEIGKLLEKLRDRADVVTARKYAALARIDPATIFPEAEAILAGAGKFRNPAQRHMQRNRALALALPPLTPLRREWHGLAFGRDLVWSDGRYRFRDYALRKRRHQPGRESYPGSVHPSVAHFVDAVLLQDEDPKYLDDLRACAEEQCWQLFMHPDGASVSPNYVSTVWSSKLGTGAHIARTIVYDILFALGEDATRGGLVLNDHPSRQAASHYVGQQARAASLASAARAMDDLADMYGVVGGWAPSPNETG